MKRTTPKLMFIVGVLYLSVVGRCMAQPTPQAESPPTFEIHPDANRLGFDPDDLKVIDSKLALAVKQQKIAGCNVLIMKDGQEICYGGWGERDREKSLPIDRDTIFRIYSMTKPITSIAVMQLVEQGKISLDDPVSKFLPEFANLKVLEKDSRGQLQEVVPKRPMTVRDLLRHTSGLTYGLFGNTDVDQMYKKAGILVRDRDVEQTVERLGKIPLLNHPGSKFVYSVSTDVLGRIVEVVSEESFDEYLRKRIFEPLEMTDSFFNVPMEKQARLAQLYSPAPTKGIKPANPMQSFRFLSSLNEYYSGGGGLCSTVVDYSKFCQMLLQEGKFNEHQIVKPQTLKEMFTNQLGQIDRPPGQFKFGLGFAISDLQDFGWNGAAGTGFWVNPDRQLAIIYMVQIMPDGDRNYRDEVHKAVYRAIK